MSFIFLDSGRRVTEKLFSFSDNDPIQSKKSREIYNRQRATLPQKCESSVSEISGFKTEETSGLGLGLGVLTRVLINPQFSTF